MGHAAGIFLLLLLAAFLMQAATPFLIHAPVMTDTMAADQRPLRPAAAVPGDTVPEENPTVLSVTLPALGTPGTPGNATPVPETIVMAIPATTVTDSLPVNIWPYDTAGQGVTVTGTAPYAYLAPAMGSSPEIPVISPASLAERVHELVNRERAAHGIPPLGKDPALMAIAKAHSADMAAHGYFGHVNLQEMDPTARGAAAGFTCHKGTDRYYSYTIAENLFAIYRYDSVLFVNAKATGYTWNTEEKIARDTVDAWMNSTGHRENLLDPDMGREGIGVATSSDDLVFVTEDMC